jgi:hypothetical protein
MTLGAIPMLDPMEQLAGAARTCFFQRKMQVRAVNAVVIAADKIVTSRSSIEEVSN